VMKSFLECLGAHHGEHCLHRRQMNINKRSQRRPLTMKPIPVITMATFVLVFGTVAPARAEMLCLDLLFLNVIERVNNQKVAFVNHIFENHDQILS
jgi:hypothetical protein